MYVLRASLIKAQRACRQALRPASLLLTALSFALSCPAQAQDSPAGSNPAEAPSGLSLGEGYFLSTLSLNQALDETWGIQTFFFHLGIPELNSASEFVYFGPSYRINDQLNLGLLGGMSFNFPEKKTLPLVALNAWGQILEPLSYYLEADMIGLPNPTWFYMAKLDYQVHEAISLGLWGWGFGSDQQELQLAPYLRWSTDRGPANLGVMLAGFVSTTGQIHPTVMLDAYF